MPIVFDESGLSEPLCMEGLFQDFPFSMYKAVAMVIKY